MGDKLDGIREFRTKACNYLKEEILIREKALQHMDKHPLVESDREVRMLREEQSKELRREITLLRSNLNVIEKML